MTIVVGVDGSGPSRAAVTWALRRAAHLGCAVELVHVATQPAEDSQWMLAVALDLASGFMPGLEVSTRELHGDPVTELTAAAVDAELLVIGTHKTGYLHGRVLGTRSIVVASMARCPLAVVPDGPATRRRGVVVGVAHGPSWRDAVILGATDAQRLGDALSLIHADENGLGRELLAEASALATETAPEIIVRSRLSRRRPSEALLDASRAEGVLVLGQSRDPAMFLGSVAHEVLLNINSPVMIARG